MIAAHTFLPLPRLLAAPASLLQPEASEQTLATFAMEAAALTLQGSPQSSVALLLASRLFPSFALPPLPPLRLELTSFTAIGVLHSGDQPPVPVRLRCEEQTAYLEPLAVRQRETSLRLRLRILRRYRQVPVISQLSQRYNLQVNILAALLGSGTAEDGWFDLELSGQKEALDEALTYLHSLGLQLWFEPDATLQPAHD